jgi:hypothetical protein
MMLVEPLISFDRIARADLNRCLVAWGHKMGPWTRPEGYPEWFHGLRQHGQLVAVVAAGALIRERVAGLDRSQALELGRVCADRPTLNRVIVRLWREAVFTALAEQHGYTWAVSYQDAVMHRGNLYRFDGWVQLGASRSGSDRRRGGKGRSKIIWGWSHDEAVLDGARNSVEEAA